MDELAGTNAGRARHLPPVAHCRRRPAWDADTSQAQSCGPPAVAGRVRGGDLGRCRRGGAGGAACVARMEADALAASCPTSAPRRTAPRGESVRHRGGAHVGSRQEPDGSAGRVPGDRRLLPCVLRRLRAAQRLRAAAARRSVSRGGFAQSQCDEALRCVGRDRSF